MYKRMLVLLDGSKLAEVVFSYARELSGRLNLELDLLHVCSPQESELMPMRQAYVEHMAEVLEKEAAEVRKKAGIPDNEKRTPAVGKVAVGYPADEILKFAEERKIDIIMLTTHGSSGVRRWGLGSVAEKVIHGTKAATWIVPTEIHEDIIWDKFVKRSILIPLDGSPAAESILPRVEALTRQRGVETELILTFVAKLPQVPMVAPSREFFDDIKAIKESGLNYLNGVVEKVKKSGFNARAVLLEGEPAEEIVQYASESHPLLIAMSTHARTGVSRFIFGSVTENVMHQLKRTPLFLVGPPEK